MSMLPSSWTDTTATRHKHFLSETSWVSISVDSTLPYDSFFRKDEPGRELVQITNQVLKQAIGACGPGKHFKDIGKVIHNLLRDINYSVSSQFTGHGIGKIFHTEPWIFHHCMLSPHLKYTIWKSDIYSKWRARYNGARSLFYNWGTYIFFYILNNIWLCVHSLPLSKGLIQKDGFSQMVGQHQQK